jgi:hypothetical protein
MMAVMAIGMTARKSALHPSHHVIGGVEHRGKFGQLGRLTEIHELKEIFGEAPFTPVMKGHQHQHQQHQRHDEQLGAVRSPNSHGHLEYHQPRTPAEATLCGALKKMGVGVAGELRVDPAWPHRRPVHITRPTSVALTDPEQRLVKTGQTR